jgi:uncharacterized protein YcaQ
LVPTRATNPSSAANAIVGGALGFVKSCVSGSCGWVVFTIRRFAWTVKPRWSGGLRTISTVQPKVSAAQVSSSPAARSPRGRGSATGAVEYRLCAMAVAREQVPVEEARRIALAAQGLAAPRPSRVGTADLRRAIDQVGVLQLDAVNVLCRSHYLPLFARLGPYRRAALDEMVWGDGRHELFEFWAHAASLLPVDTYPLLRWRMEAAARWVWERWLARPQGGWRQTWDPAIQAPWAVIEGMMRIARERPELVEEVLAVVAARGPVAARDASPDGRPRRGPEAEGGRMWSWQDAKITLEWLFCAGRVTTATRRHFERVYDLTERVLPPDVLAAPMPGPADAQRELVRIAARAQGIATERQLADYFHLPPKESGARVAELVEAGELVPARVDGVSKPMYRWARAEAPSRVRACALLSPFDSLIWDRRRTLELFGFHYRISIYTRAEERVHGYYVMPFLLDERLVARVDLKADRDASALLVPSAHAEPGIHPADLLPDLAAELRLMASWLELERVVASPVGDLGAALANAIHSS